MLHFTPTCVVTSHESKAFSMSTLICVQQIADMDQCEHRQCKTDTCEANTERALQHYVTWRHYRSVSEMKHSMAYCFVRRFLMIITKQKGMNMLMLWQFQQNLQKQLKRKSWNMNLTSFHGLLNLKCMSFQNVQPGFAAIKPSVVHSVGIYKPLVLQLGSAIVKQKTTTCKQVEVPSIVQSTEHITACE